MQLHLESGTAIVTSNYPIGELVQLHLESGAPLLNPNPNPQP